MIKSFAEKLFFSKCYTLKHLYEVHVCAEESAPVLMPPVFDFLENDSCPTMMEFMVL